MLKNTLFRSILLLGLLLVNSAASAATTLVAVAANFTKPMTEIAEAFEKSTGHKASLSFGSSGKFVSQFENGGPFEVFLSADDKGPIKLEQSGLAVANTRFTYALGKLVLWSATPGLVDDQGQVLNKGGFKHIALADPKLAPYGEAAVEVMKNRGLFDKLQPLFVQGENIAQTHQFVSTGNAELGFVAFSQVIDNGKIAGGSGWIIPSDLYKPIRQDAILMKTGAENPAASALMQFLKSPEALAIIRKYGYDLAQ
ncbi:molybdate ABC transporter substrate-binding protein [Candidatus Methylobacter oryzae]|uniref:Molybdate ABC transporter substrate-binding protein n=1 Tax=Candidatus Methylobacter oryzae TaxID=2497749 RepID=A0ABY3C4J2_9GAMM|nr:molybdate ABC transporter substrate-binding protein [Candidatus Methylobacter oryzae]TRW89636.1 molybdate ABC transporter substrate-binding protein [Candidatus Methylobacter oryzae]